MYDSYIFVPRMPYLQMQTKDSIMIKWQTPEAEIGCVEYSLKDISKKACEDKESRYHTLTLQNLEEGSTYTYKVLSKSLKIDNSNRSFKPLHSDLNTTQNIWIIGDSGKAGPGQNNVYQAMQNYMQDKPLDLWLLLGDNAYRSGSQKQYNKAFFKPYKELLKSTVPWAVIGNHDARRWAFYDIFDFPTEGETGGVPSGTEKFFALEQGNLHILMLDSETTDLSKNGEMAKWLEKDLKANNKLWTIAVLHHPPYSDGGHNSDNPLDSHSRFSLEGKLFSIRENIIPILEKYDVDLVYSGHSHGYERSKLLHKHYGTSDTFDKDKHIIQDNNASYCKTLEPKPYKGTIYTVAGSAAKLDHGRLEHPALPFSYESLGSVMLKVTPNSLESKFLDSEGKIKDQFILYKQEDCSSFK